MDSSWRLESRAQRLDEILREIELHVAAGRDRLARQARIVALTEELQDDEGRDANLARQLFLAMRETQESLEGAARQLRALAAGLDVDSELISQSEFAVAESFNAMGRLSH
jgi:hypothetical protein